jgi:hypothetical protein
MQQQKIHRSPWRQLGIESIEAYPVTVQSSVNDERVHILLVELVIIPQDKYRLILV